MDSSYKRTKKVLHIIIQTA